MTNAANTGRRVPLALLLAIGACSSAPTGSAPPSSGSAAVAPPASGVTAPSGAVPFNGYIQQIYSTGDFVLVVGNVSYAVVMSPTTVVFNLRGRQVSRNFMTAALSVAVTGTLVDSTIHAQSIVVPTRKDNA